MKIKHVTGFGFLSLGDFSFEIGGKGVTLIEGANNDSTAISNGAGKSSLFESILWCLYGVTRRGLTGDDVINRHFKAGCCVQVFFSSKGVEYAATRARKAKLPFENGEGISTGLYLHLVDGADLTKGTIKDTQDLLESIIGMSALSFQKAIYFGQGDVKPMAELSDSELKLVFEQALGLTQITNDWAMASAHRKALDYTLSSAQAKKAAKEVTAITAQQAIDDYEKTIAEFDQKKAARVAELEQAISTINAELQINVGQFHAISAEATKLAEEKKLAEEQLQKMQLLKSQFQEKIKEVEIAFTTAGAHLVSKQSSLSRHSEKIKSVSSLVGSECETCGQVLDAEGAKTFISRIQSFIDQVGKEAGALQQTKAEKQAVREQMQGMLAAFDKKLSEASAGYSNAVGIHQGKAQMLAGLKGKIEQLNASVSMQQSNLKKELESGVDLQSRIAEMKAGYNATIEQIQELEKELFDISEKLEIAAILEESLSNSGLKNYVLAGVTPEINQYANSYLSVLDPSMAVDISTITTLKSGEEREKFSIVVETENGSKGFKGHSGGEKQKVNLAISLAFNTMVRNSSGEAINLLVLDEPFESLDEGSSEQVIELIQGIDADNIYLISHNQAVKDLIPNKIKIEKTKGIAKIVAK